MSAISVLIADDHLLLREMIIHVLKQDGRFSVTTTASLAETLAEIDSHGPFDVVLLDVVMPGMAGLPSVSEVIERNKGRSVALMSGMIQREFIEASLQRGALGYVPKTLPISTLTQVLVSLSQGKTYLPFDLYAKAPPALPPSLASLSPQEARVLRYLCQGLSNKEIAREMSIGEVTIKSHMRAVCAKLDARNRTEAALIGSQHLRAGR